MCRQSYDLNKTKVLCFFKQDNKTKKLKKRFYEVSSKNFLRSETFHEVKTETLQFSQNCNVAAPLSPKRPQHGMGAEGPFLSKRVCSCTGEHNAWIRLSQQRTRLLAPLLCLASMRPGCVCKPYGKNVTSKTVVLTGCAASAGTWPRSQREGWLAASNRWYSRKSMTHSA